MRMTLRKNFIFGLIIATGTALLAEDAPNANDASKRIVVLGDSITAGYGLDPSEAYPALLQKTYLLQKIHHQKYPQTG